MGSRNSPRQRIKKKKKKLFYDYSKKNKTKKQSKLQPLQNKFCIASFYLFFVLFIGGVYDQTVREV